MAEEDCFSTQLIDSDGLFDEPALDGFVKKTELSDCGLSYTVVAVIGPQSSGKSTLMNHLFYTNFQEMDAYIGRNQTTKGIWIARCPGINPFTIAMDIEGTDGSERGEDDTTFEKQSALFALTVADVLLINMWCHDIGREKAANRPLLKTVFEVMMRLFSPRRTTLLFVIRDKTKTPVQKLEQILMEDIEKIWNFIAKPNAHKETPFSDFFNVEVIALSRYDDDNNEQFKEQVGQLRQRFFNSISPRGLAGDRRGVVPASGFSISLQQIWKTIKENKDLDLPAHKVMVATVRCEEIVNEKLSALSSDMDWLALSEDVQAGPVSGFGLKLGSILEKYFSEYDNEAIYFDEGVKNAKQQQLKTKALELVHPAFITILGHLRRKTLDRFKTLLEQSLNNGEGFAVSVHACAQSCLLDFDKGSDDAAVIQADWSASMVREKLCHNIEEHASFTRSLKLPEITSKYEKQLGEALDGPVGSLLEAGENDTWPSIRNLLEQESENAVSEFTREVASFELDESAVESMVQNLRVHARHIVKEKARAEARDVLILMKDRFSTIFSHDNDSMPRVWTTNEDMTAITKEARSASLKLLSVMAAIRLDERPDEIEHVLTSSLMDGTVVAPLASSSWNEVSREDTLLTPARCKSLWTQFKAETEYLITQAMTAQGAHEDINIRSRIQIELLRKEIVDSIVKVAYQYGKGALGFGRGRGRE